MKNDNQFVSNVVSKFAPNKEYYEYFRDLIKCYKEYYQRQMKDTVDTVVDIVFYHQNNSYQHHIVLCDEKWQYIVSPITATSSKKYERIIPLFDKNPYFNGYLLCNNGLFGLMNSDFEEIVPCLYESLIPYCFVKESNPYNNEVTMSTVALFCATKSDFSSEFITIDGYKVFDGYDCINPLKAELEYRYYEVDGILYHTVLEKLTSFIISYDWESPCFYKIDFPMYQECVYHIKEFEDKFELHIDNLMLEASNIQEIPQCEVQISKAQNFGINVVALMNTKLEFETVSGMTVEEYLQSIFFENISGDMSIDALDLTVRSYNSLKRGGINTVYDLCNIQEEALLKIQNIGKNQKQELLLMRKKLCDALKSKSNDA